MVRSITYIILNFILFLLGTENMWSQTYISNWSEQEQTNKIDSVRIEVDKNKITIVIPKNNGSILVFKGDLHTDLDPSEPQQLIAKLKEVSPHVDVSPEYLQTLKNYPPYLKAEALKGEKHIEFVDSQIRFYAPMPSEANTAQNSYDYQTRNIFIAEKTWEIKSKSFEFRQFIDMDAHYGFGLVCGFADGLLEDAKMVISIAEFADQNTLFVFGDMQLIDKALNDLDQSYKEKYSFLLPKEFSTENTKARKKQLEIVMAIGPFLTDTKKLKELGSVMYTEMGAMMSEWFKETVGDETSAIAGYQHGKIMYGIVTMFIGVKEVSMMLKGGDASLDIIRIIKNMACFTATTPVHTNYGTVLIEQLRLGVLTNTIEKE